MHTQIKYRFRTTLTGKQVLQIFAEDHRTSFCRHTGDEHTTEFSRWRDASREEADAVFLLLANDKLSDSPPSDNRTMRGVAGYSL